MSTQEPIALEYLAIPYVFEDRPLWWHKAGLSQTASGYGSKLTSSKVVLLKDGRVRRVYITCWSNSGSAWITLGKQTLWLSDFGETERCAACDRPLWDGPDCQECATLRQTQA